MAATSVTGAFVIIDRASRPIRRIREEAQKTDATVKRLGANLDRIGTREQRQQMERTAGLMRKVGKESAVAAEGTKRMRSEARQLGQPQVAQNISRTAQSISNVERAAEAAGPTVSDMAQGVRQLDRDSDSAGGALRRFAGTAMGLRQVLLLSLIPAIGLAAQAIGALGVGVGALLPQLQSLLSLGAPMGAGLLGMATAAVTAKLAFKDLGAAVNGSWDDMKKLTPQAREFVRTLRQYKPVVEDLRRSAQSGLFPGLDLALRRLQRGVPVINSMLRTMGARLGGIGASAAGFATRRGFLNDLEMLSGQGGQLLQRGARALMNIADAMRHVLVEAMPFTDWLSRTVVGWTRGWKEAARLGRETGSLAGWFRRAREDLEQFGRITGNVWDTLRGISRAISPLGETLWRSIERVTAGWARFTNSTRGQNDMRRYFAQMRVPLREVVGLGGDLVQSLGRLSAGGGLTASLRALRQAMPALERGLGAMAEAFGPAVIGALSQVLQLFGTLASDAGPLTTVAKLFGSIVGGLNWMLEHIPGLGTIIASALTVSLISRFATALGGLSSKWLGVAASARQAASAERAATTAGMGGVGSALLPGARGQAARQALRQRGGFRGAMRGASPETIAMVGGTAAMVGGAAVPGVGGSVLTGVGSGAALGAAAGSIIPGVGTAIGAGVGAAVGGIGGLIGGRRAREQALLQQGADQATAFLGSSPSAAAIQRRIGQLQPQLRDAQRGYREDRQGFRYSVDRSQASGIQKQLDALRPALKVQVQVERQQAIREAREAGQRLAFGLGQAFNVYDRRVGMRRAMEMTASDVQARMKTLGPIGRRALATNMVQWAREQARQNPKLIGEVREMERKIERQFDRLGQHVDVVNGTIVTGSRKDWQRIGRNLEDPVEQAKQRVTRGFTRMQEIAISQLSMMGFSRTEARRIVRGLEAGGQRGATADAVLRTGGQSRTQRNRLNNVPPQAAGAARGARIGGMGTQDTVPVAPGWLAAPGELIVNRHTEARIDRKLMRFGTSLGREVAGETRRHSTPISENAAKGGRVGDLNIVNLGRQLQRLGYHVSEHPSFGGVQGGHATNSWHYRAGAIDVNADNFAGGEMRALDAVAGRIRRMGFNVLWRVADHFDHLHADIGGGAVGGGIGRGGSLAGVGAAMRPLRIGRQRTGVGGVGGLIGDLALEHGRRALQRSLNERVGAGGGIGGGIGGGVSARGGLNAWLTQALKITGHFSPQNLQLLRGRAMQESGGDPNAINTWDSNAAAGTPSIGLLQTIGPTFDAYKLPGMGNIRHPVHNAVAAIRYMMARYGHIVGPGGGGYALGGRVPDWGGWFARGGRKRYTRPTLIGVGDGGQPEDVTITPGGGGRGGRPGGGVVLNFHPGSIVVHGGGAEAGREVADAVIERITNALREMGMEPEGAMG